MEELRSTDILDKEIQDDARKKAEKILKNADAQGQQILADVETRLESAKKDRESYYSQKAAQFKKDLDSSLPLEKSRFLVSYISSSVASAINDYLKTISQEKRIQLVLTMLNRFESLTDGKSFEAAVYGFNLDLAKNELNKNNKLHISSFLATEFAKTGEVAVDGIEIHEGIILVSDDKVVKIRLTLEELFSELIDKYRNELAVTLFGGRLPE
ncbi:MAG: V-type ATP synthase subunit E family protein [Spirochaetia bacterium]|nr:V-type ATP synthase subunit E family protein [Spirochaetia bacterium]MDD7698568.1 V-type ATP synthase subunit E family protein [Spirochaetia bacterium]MDY4211808.1 V-type ATP synthase subunit E family protein [Treponema sp.]